jgi:O-antigen/teichoic acid export membrane protein
LNLFLNALLIPTWGLWGAVAATSVASFCCLFLNNVFAALFGFAVGHRIWLASLLPLVLLLPADWFAAVAITLVAVVWKTTWIFDAAEKQLAESMLQSQLAKIVSNLYPGRKR